MNETSPRDRRHDSRPWMWLDEHDIGLQPGCDHATVLEAQCLRRPVRYEAPGIRDVHALLARKNERRNGHGRIVVVGCEDIAEPRAGRDVMDLLFRLSRDKGLTLIYVSHHMAHAAGFSDRIVGLACGRVVLDRLSESSDARELSAFFEESELQFAPALAEQHTAIRISA